MATTRGQIQMAWAGQTAISTYDCQLKGSRTVMSASWFSNLPFAMALTEHKLPVLCPEGLSKRNIERDSSG